MERWLVERGVGVPGAGRVPAPTTEVSAHRGLALLRELRHEFLTRRLERRAARTERLADLLDERLALSHEGSGND